jgi:hypothetical protein
MELNCGTAAIIPEDMRHPTLAQEMGQVRIHLAPDSQAQGHGQGGGAWAGVAQGQCLTQPLGGEGTDIACQAAKATGARADLFDQECALQSSRQSPAGVNGRSDAVGIVARTGKHQPGAQVVSFAQFRWCSGTIETHPVSGGPVNTAAFHFPQAENGQPPPQAPLGPDQHLGVGQHGSVQKNVLLAGWRIDEQSRRVRLAGHDTGGKHDGEKGQDPVAIQKGQAGSDQGPGCYRDGQLDQKPG